MNYFARNRFCVAQNNNYLLAGNLCNAFAIGEVGSLEDFFLVGSEPEGESSYPLLTGNILDSEGNVLFRLVRNVLVVNPGHCSKIAANLCGYEIHDSAGKPIFSVSTVFERPPTFDDESLPAGAREVSRAQYDPSREMFITTIKGTFYDRGAKVAFRANSGEPDEHVEVATKFLFGFPGGPVHGYSGQELEFVRVVVATHGRVQRPLLGEVRNQEITLDGLALIATNVTDCTVHVHSGNFAAIGEPHFTRCAFVFHDDAERIRRLVLAAGASREGVSRAEI
jgi:hypothetical protein